jgi:hypothetical protein
MRSKRSIKHTFVAKQLCNFGILLGITVLPSNGGAAGSFRKLSGTQILSVFNDAEFTDHVHWREVYETSGILRNYEMGGYRRGKWFVRNDRLCVQLGVDVGETCYEIWAAGNRVKFRRGASDGAAFEGILQKPTDNGNLDVLQLHE